MNIQQVVLAQRKLVAVLMSAALAFSVLMSGSGCERSTEAAIHGAFDVQGHWVGETGSGRALTMNLHGVGSGFTDFTGQMTLDGVTGELDGKLDQPRAHFEFTVKWPSGGETTGDANVYDDGHMKDGTLKESGTTDTFTANRQ